MATVAGTPSLRIGTHPQSSNSYPPGLEQPLSAPPRHSGEHIRCGHISLSTFSPVNQSGCFEFDRVIKSGQVLKRNKRTKVWKPAHLVLRPNLLSIYKDQQETKLRHQVNLSDIIAVALQKPRDRKRERAGMFGIFSPTRTFYLEASSEVEANSWVDLIGKEARIEQEDDVNMEIISPSGTDYAFNGYIRPSRLSRDVARHQKNRQHSNSPDPVGRAHTPLKPERTRPVPIEHSSYSHEHSGNEHGSQSDFSDSPDFHAARDNAMSDRRAVSNSNRLSTGSVREAFYAVGSPRTGPNVSQLSFEDRVLRHGYLLCLKSRRGVRQWKRYWVVLRSKNMALYKNEEEYAAILIIPLTSVMDAVDIDPSSKSKEFCMQIITDDRSYKFCASNEDDLAQWLGCLKSVLAKRKEASSRPVP